MNEKQVELIDALIQTRLERYFPPLANPTNGDIYHMEEKIERIKQSLMESTIDKDTKE